MGVKYKAGRRREILIIFSATEANWVISGPCSQSVFRSRRYYRLSAPTGRQNNPLPCHFRLLRPDGGSIAVNGEVSPAVPGYRFNKELTGRENIFSTDDVGFPPAYEKIYQEIVDFAGLELSTSPLKTILPACAPARFSIAKC